LNKQDFKGLKKIKLLALDFDGVLTDGLSFCDGQGGEGVFCSVQDGSAVTWLHRAGFQSAIITGRDSPSLDHRVKTLGVNYVYKGMKFKLEGYESLKASSGLKDEHIAYAGDDLIDLPVMRRTGFSFAVNNARGEVKAQADYTTAASGGAGAVREIIELLLKQQGKWEEITRRYFSDPESGE